MLRTCLEKSPRSQFKPCIRLLHWPTTPNPTPYQIFGLEPEKSRTIDKRKVRDVYFDLVKLYHPDSGTTGNADRFKKVVEAYNILKCDSRRRSYDLTQSTSSYPSSAPRYYRQSYNAFEDDIDMNYWSNKNQKEFDDGLSANRMWVLKFITTITVTVAFINLMLLKEAAEARNEALTLETERAAAQLAASSSNYGRGSEAEHRIQRFLEHRQAMLDRFENQFTWDKFKLGSNGQQAKYSTDEPLLTSSDSNPSNLPDPRMANATKIQTKRHSGSVAEYFGRN